KLSKLFTSKLEKKDGGFASAPKVKMILKQFIHQEDKNKPFSDQKISDYLKEEKNISLSRRTIAKYKEELNILPASKRKVVVYPYHNESIRMLKQTITNTTKYTHFCPYEGHSCVYF